MRFETPDIVNESGDQQVFRSSRVANFLAWLLFAAPLAFVPELLQRWWEHGWWLTWVVGGPIALLMGLLWGLVVWSMAGAFFCSMAPSNWLLRVAPGHGVALNLRSYLNAHPEDDDPTVLLLSFREIVSARRVRQVLRMRNHEGSSYQVRSWLELELAVDTSELAETLEQERGREGRWSKVLGVRSRTKFHHHPVRVEAPGRVRVEWKRGMLAALEKAHVSTQPLHRERLGFEGEDRQAA